METDVSEIVSAPSSKNFRYTNDMDLYPTGMKSKYKANVTAIKLLKELLESEVKLYDHYLTGDVYGYQLFERDTKIDSCWGFIGDIRDVQDQIKEYLPEECREIVEGLHYEYVSLDITHYLQNEMEDEDELEL